jgi:hypothetical protein
MDMNEMQVPVQIQSYQIKKEKLDAVYPVVRGLSNYLVEQKINGAILQEVYNLIQQQGYPHNPQTESSGYYELKTNERGILSLSLFNYAFSGGAHGLTLQKSLTFDVQTGKLYRLQDLFMPDAPYIQVLSDIITQQIKDRDVPLLDEFTGIRPDQDFYIADKALIIYFQLYEITPYVYGFAYFPISVFEIQSIIKEEGPLGKMIY